MKKGLGGSTRDNFAAGQSSRRRSDATKTVDGFGLAGVPSKHVKTGAIKI